MKLECIELFVLQFRKITQKSSGHLQFITFTTIYINFEQQNLIELSAVIFHYVTLNIFRRQTAGLSILL